MELFEKRAGEDGGVNFVVCELWKHSLKCLYGTTSSLRAHLRAKHASSYKQLSDIESSKRKAAQQVREYLFQLITGELNPTSGNIVNESRSKLLTQHVMELTFLHENL